MKKNLIQPAYFCASWINQQCCLSQPAKGWQSKSSVVYFNQLKAGKPKAVLCNSTSERLANIFAKAGKNYISLKAGNIVIDIFHINICVTLILETLLLIYLVRSKSLCVDLTPSVTFILFCNSPIWC